VTQTSTDRLHIVESTDWLLGVIALLESRARCRPWRYGFGEARRGDPVAIVLNTEPASILTTLGSIGADEGSGRAVVDWTFVEPKLLDLATLVHTVGFGWDPRRAWRLEGDDAVRMELTLTESHHHADPSLRFGHTSVVRARILLHSRGRCSGRDTAIDLVQDDARDSFRFHTVHEPARDAPEVLIMDDREACSYREGFIPDSCWRPDLPEDWPGVLCRRCQDRMRENGFTNLLDFRFSQHPKCLACGAGRTQRALFGMLMHRDIPPWLDARGCCVTDDIWTCTECTNTW
jgi:hypothetical protein